MAMRAATMTRFFTTYCPTRVRENGSGPKTSDGKNRNTENVHAMCQSAMATTARCHRCVMSMKPMAVSIRASRMIDVPGATSPKVSFVIVSVASDSAGLTPEKNLSAPNQM